MTNKGEVISFKGNTPIGPAFFAVNWLDDDGAIFVSPKAKLIALTPPGLTDVEQLNHTPAIVMDVVKRKGEVWDVAVALDIKDVVGSALRKIMKDLPIGVLTKIRDTIKAAPDQQSALAGLKVLATELERIKAQDGGIDFDDIDWSKVNRV